jgi:hypothetical protein
MVVPRGGIFIEETHGTVEVKSAGGEIGKADMLKQLKIRIASQLWIVSQCLEISRTYFGGRTNYFLIRRS